MVYQSCSLYDLKADAEGVSLTCFLLTVLHVLDSSTSQPVFLNQVYLRPLGWIYSCCFAKIIAQQLKLFCWVWLYGVCIMISVSILNVLFQPICISLVTIPTPLHPTPPHPTLKMTVLNQCSQSWQLTDGIGNIQQFCEASEDPIWETPHEKSSMVALHVVPQGSEVQGQMLWACGDAVI